MVEDEDEVWLSLINDDDVSLEAELIVIDEVEETIVEEELKVALESLGLLALVLELDGITLSLDEITLSDDVTSEEEGMMLLED